MPQLGSILTLLLQVALILALSRLMGALFARLHQPQVIGEMVAGIMLGPSLLGWLAPHLSANILFPAHSLSYLDVLSQIGVIFFLFLVGLDIDTRLIRRQGTAATAISASSIAVPFLMGIGLTYLLYPIIASNGSTHFTATALFMGAAISVTAFPVLARILTERNLHRTEVGAISLTAAAVNDVMAWCLLALVVATAHYRGPAQFLWTVTLAAAYVLFMLLAVRPLLAKLQVVYERQGRLSQNVVAVIFLLVLVSAMATERIGIHALFGAFLMGFVMPKGTRFVRHLSEKLEDHTVVFLLPLFFASAGLKTDLTQLLSADRWPYMLLVIAVACAGKFGGSALVARLCGLSWRPASAIGVLMNTRGLMELIILRIGLELGVINQAIFAMMVVMALVTTAMAAPLLHLLYPARLREPGRAPGSELPGVFSVLIPVSLPRSGRPLLRIADALSGPDAPRRMVHALYLRRPADHESYRAGLDEMDSPRPAPLQPLLEEADRRGLDVKTHSFISRDVASDIAAVAARTAANLVLMGFHKPLIGRTILGGTVHRVLEQTATDVAIFVDRGFHGIHRVLVPYLGGPHDHLALQLASRLARNAAAHVTVLHVVPPNRAQGAATLNARGIAQRAFEEPGAAIPVNFRLIEDFFPVDAVLREAPGYDLVIIGVSEQWGLESHLFGFKPERIARDCPTSLLLVREHTPTAPHPAAPQPTAAEQGSVV